MLTADGTRRNARAAPEKEPWSTTARKRSMSSLDRDMYLSVFLKGDDFFNQPF